MANAKITALTENTTPVSTDILPMVDDPAGTPVTQKITIANLLSVGISDTAYAGSWNGVTTIAPSKNAVYDQMELKAPLASPTFTGTVTLPKTLEIHDTTGDHQYVLAVSELAADRTVTLPLLTTADTFVFNDHAATLTNKTINIASNTLTGVAPLASPTFTGTPAAPTAAADTNTTQVATTAFVLAQAASQAELETATSTTKFVTAGRAQYHPSSAKFWAQVTGAGTPSLTTNYNVASIADTGTGRMTITIGTDFSSANWCLVSNGMSSGSTVTLSTHQWGVSKAAGTIELDNCDASATPVVEDPAVGYDAAGFGDQ